MCCFDLLERDDSQCVVVCVVVQGQFDLSFVPICKEVHYSPTISLALLLDWVAFVVQRGQEVASACTFTAPRTSNESPANSQRVSKRDDTVARRNAILSRS